MKSLNYFFSLLLLNVVLFAAGCNKENNPLNNNNNNNNNNGSSYPMPTEFGGATPTHILGLIRTSVSTGGFTVSTGVGVANLNNQDKGDVSVKVGGSTYTFAKSTSGGNTSYFFPNPSAPQVMTIAGNGLTNAEFNVTGYSLQQKVVGVPGVVTLNSPAAGSTVPRTSDLTLNWSAQDAGVYNAIFITDQNGNTKFKQNLSGVTSATFSASELGALSAGSAYVYALTYNFVISNNNEAVLIGQAVAVNQITLQ